MGVDATAGRTTVIPNSGPWGDDERFDPAPDDLFAPASNYLRASMVNDALAEVTGWSLHGDVSSETVREISAKLDAWLEAGNGNEARVYGDQFSSRHVEPDTLRSAAHFLRVCAANGLEIHAY